MSLSSGTNEERDSGWCDAGGLLSATMARATEFPADDRSAHVVTRDSSARPAEDALAAALASTGSRFAFGLPGGGANLTMVGALERHGLSFVLNHGETAACIAAATYGYVSGSVSAVVVTRGPGAASAINGAAQATLDRQPLVLVTDTVAADQRARIAHQRIDQRSMLAPVTKASGPLFATNASAAVELAAAAPPGAVHLDQDEHAREPAIVMSAGSAHADASSLSLATDLIANANAPVVILGVGAPTSAELRARLESFGAPAFTTYQAVGVIDTCSPINAGLFTGGAPERQLIERADLVVLVGLDMVEPIPAAWPGVAPIVSITATPTVETYAPITVELVGDVVDLTDRCLRSSHHWSPTSGADHREKTRAQVRECDPADLGPIVVVDAAREWAESQPNLTTTVDAGAHFLAIMPLWDVVEPRRLLISNGLATMGYALPAAIGASLARPGEPVLALTGDGGLGMCLAELETLARLDLPVTVVVFNDAALSLIQIKQRDGQGGDAAVRYRPTDFAAVARAHHVSGVRATTSAELSEALAASPTGPRLIDVQVDPAAYPALIAATRR